MAISKNHYLLFYDFSRNARSNKLFTINDLKNNITKNAMIGEISMPNFKDTGSSLRMGESIGSVLL